MRKLMMLIALLLGLTLLAPAMAEETAYTDMLASWADVPYGAQDIPVSLADYETADLGLTEEMIGGETALCWRTGLGAVTFKVNVPEKGLYNIGGPLCPAGQRQRADRARRDGERRVSLRGLRGFPAEQAVPGC